MDNLTFKATLKYRERCQATGEACRLPGDRSGVHEVGGRRFIVLKDDDGIIAVFETKHQGARYVAPTEWPAGID